MWLLSIPNQHCSNWRQGEIFWNAVFTLIWRYIARVDATLRGMVWSCRSPWFLAKVEKTFLIFSDTCIAATNIFKIVSLRFWLLKSSEADHRLQFFLRILKQSACHRSEERRCGLQSRPAVRGRRWNSVKVQVRHLYRRPPFVAVWFHLSHIIFYCHNVFISVCGRK